MNIKDFYKVGGSSQDGFQLIKIGKRNWVLIYGVDSETENGYSFRKNYGYKPTAQELHQDIDNLINNITDEKILNDFVWNGMGVYLSSENQMNFKAVHDIVVQSDSTMSPITFKLSEDENGQPIYHEFKSKSEISDFYLKAVSFIHGTLEAGWKEKDSVDIEKLLEE